MRILTDHLNNVAKTLEKNSAQLSIANHGDVTGQAREALSKSFLKNHLPDSVSYFTGEIFDQNDMRSGQMDIIIHPTHSPKLNLIENINLVFADAALAVIEVKSTLTTASIDSSSHLKSALDSCVKIKSMKRSLTIKGQKNNKEVKLDKIPFFIFAFNGPTSETLREKIYEYQKLNNLCLDMMPDIITVLNREYYLAQNNGWLIDHIKEEVHWTQNQQPEGVLIGMFAYITQIIEAYGTNPHPMPFGAYLSDLLKEP